jgi:hypothetical protein
VIFRILGAILLGGGSIGAFAGWMLTRWLDARAQRIAAAVRRRTDPDRKRSPRMVRGDRTGRVVPLVQCAQRYEHPGHLWHDPISAGMEEERWCDGRNADGTTPYDPGRRPNGRGALTDRPPPTMPPPKPGGLPPARPISDDDELEGRW